jgi:hypothetical protein
MTGQPPAGGVPLGIETVPDTATGCPAGSTDRYSTSVFRAALGSAMVPDSARAQIGEPATPSGNWAGGT